VDPTSEQANEARARLRAERRRLETILHELEADYRDSGGISTLSGDAGADSTHADASIGLQRDTQHQIDEVDAALQRVDAGTYGLDEVTGEPIDPARLEVLPAARTNVR
jgi:RNA polymerase-binding transcription factor DksA